MKNLLWLVVLCSTASALQAPYLISATAQSGSRVQLSWRNNDVATLGFVVLRSAEGGQAFGVIDTVQAGTEQIVDSTVAASTKYFYGVLAYSATEVSDTSNIDTVTTFDVPARPSLLLFQWDLSSHAIDISYLPGISGITSLRIYRSENSKPFALLRDTTGPMGDTVRLIDRTVEANKWYDYNVSAWNGTDSLADSLSYDLPPVFTFDKTLLFKDLRYQLVPGAKLSEFPIHFKRWSLKAGDTIILNETNLPDSVYSIINVADPNAPVFAGLGHSLAARLGAASAATTLHGRLVALDTAGSSEIDTIVCYTYDPLVGLQKTGACSFGAIYNCGMDYPLFVDDTTFIMGYCTVSGGGRYGDEVHHRYHKIYSIGAGSIEPVATNEYMASLYSSGCPNFGSFFVGRTFFSVDGVVLNYYRSPLLSQGGYHDTTFVVTPPRVVDSIVIVSPEMLAAKSIHLDTVKKVAYVLSPSLLTAYSYTIEPYAYTATTHFQSASLSSHNRGHLMFRKSGSRTILITLPQDARIQRVSICDLSGRMVENFEPAGQRQIVWHRANALPGVYCVVVKGRNLCLKQTFLVGK
jgi:hypothetical protein